MADPFEDALERKAAGDSDLQVLRDQWGHDKRALTRALHAVSQWFPHYSLHDHSHADTVLQQIARLLGRDRIERLSATDLWLILEAAYLHDVGMVVTDHEARRFWSSDERRDFLARHQAEHTELARAAAILEGHDVQGEHWSFEVRRALILVMAEYYRSRHAERAARVVMDPELLRLASPRPPEIPERLFGALGEICAAHGRSFEQTMALSDEQSGVGTDLAHPRFVACMLRLGDLLDLDSGRFCAVMLQTFGVLPQTSEDHRRKHASI
ncbi:MAG: HD domain-containing protein, partial [Myxococcales bacterium]|nr:HD domain-containing protein [Myxococcales bacterium]